MGDNHFGEGRDVLNFGRIVIGQLDVELLFDPLYKPHHIEKIQAYLPEFRFGFYSVSWQTRVSAHWHHPPPEFK